MKIKLIDFGATKMPFRAHENDAGADVHVCFHDRTIWTICPGQTVRVPLGMGLILPDGYMACVYPRSGLSAKGIVCELPPIDSGYRGEIHAIVHNGSNEEFVISNGDRIGQLVVMPIVIPEFTFDDVKERGDSGFGSTGI